MRKNYWRKMGPGVHPTEVTFFTAASELPTDISTLAVGELILSRPEVRVIGESPDEHLIRYVIAYGDPSDVELARFLRFTGAKDPIVSETVLDRLRWEYSPMLADGMRGVDRYDELAHDDQIALLVYADQSQLATAYRARKYLALATYKVRRSDPKLIELCAEIAICKLQQKGMK